MPQSSVLGLTFWNIFYNDLVTQETSVGIQLVSFADDLTVVVVAKTSKWLEAIVNSTFRLVDEWTSRRGLHLLNHKTEANILSCKMNYDDSAFIIRDVSITISRSIKYLGVLLDSYITFRRHIEKATDKAMETTRALGQLMPNIGGPRQKKRTLLMSLMNSRMIYATST